jgi:peptidoglycan-N-acetylglucosamine deacetylase
MIKAKPPYLISRFSRRNLVWTLPTDQKKIFLTFDDGPVPQATPIVLDILKSYGVNATFFCVGENVINYPDVFHQTITDGHAIGNHTFNHLNGWKTSTAKYIENIDLCNKYTKSELFRPPYGKITPRQIIQLRRKYALILWSVLSGDFDINTSEHKCLNNVLTYTQSGSIVVFHDSIKTIDKLSFVLPRFLAHFIERGYEFSILSPDIIKEYRTIPMLKVA